MFLPGKRLRKAIECSAFRIFERTNLVQGQINISEVLGSIGLFLLPPVTVIVILYLKKKNVI